MSQQYSTGANTGPLGFNQPTPKKKRTGLWIALGVVLLIILLGIGGCLAVTGSVVNSVDKSIAKSEEKTTPKTVKMGQAFTEGDHEIQSGWKVTKKYDSFGITAKAKNISDSTSTSFVDFRFMKGNEVVGSVTCNTTDLEPGQVQTMNCLELDKYAPYDLIQVQTTF
jgi:hypothetical protein